MTHSPPASGEARYALMRKVTLVGAVVNLLLVVAKLAGGWLAHSQALIADGIHSLSDLATDVLVLVVAKHTHRDADEDHPYGHGRIETAATVGLGVALIIVAAAIAYDAVERLVHPERLMHPGALALVVAVLSVVSKEAVYRYTLHHAERLRSGMLRANAWHHRSDALSSVAVIVGVSGAMAGFAYVDSIAALVVGAMVGKIGWDLARSSVRELVDTGLEPGEIAGIHQTIMSIDGVEALHMLRTRRMGGKILIDVHIILANARLSVSEGHQISETVRARLMSRDKDIMDVMVHIDPEDDELSAPNDRLPLRADLLRRLQAQWRDVDGAQHIRDINLHYFNGKIDVEVTLPVDLARDAAKVRARREAFNRTVADDHDVCEIRLLYG